MSSPDASGRETRRPAPPRRAPENGICQRCGFPVLRRLMGCKNPCRNCGTVYPFGDCSD